MEYSAYPDWMSWYTDTPKFTHPPGLAMMRQLMHRLGDPQDKLRCIHIAGTNGKGSVAAMCAAVLLQAGLRTGLYTSPDLVDMRERIQLNGELIPQEAFRSVTLRVKSAAEADGLDTLSFFEKITAAAFCWYAEAGCEAAVIETGLGGRCDAANILRAPVCSVITPIDMDHAAVLGDTPEAVAREKAGIIKPGCPVVTAPQQDGVAEVLRAAARDAGSRMVSVDLSRIRILERSRRGQVFSYGDTEGLRISLLGDHQAVNAACAAEACRIAGIGEEDIRTGLAAARWPCRFEYFPQDPPLILDGAHNRHGAAALARGLRTYFPGCRFTLIMGVMADKDISGILEQMEPLAARVFCIAPPSERAVPAEELAARIRSVPAFAAASPEEAYRRACTFSEPVCAFGSLYYVGAVREQAMEHSGGADIISSV